MVATGNKLNSIFVARSTSVIVVILPSILFMAVGFYSLVNAPETYVVSADPSYNYLVNSFEVMTGASPFAIHHPGTTLQYFLGIVNALTWLFFGRADGSMGLSIVQNPELYLQVDLAFLILLQCGALAYAAIRILKSWGLAPSLTFSGAVLLLTASEPNIFLVGPVAMSFALGCIAIGLVVQIASGTAPKSVNFLFGSILVAGFMNKATFMPMLAFFAIYLITKGFRAALLGAISTGVLFLILIRDQVLHLGYWFIGILSTTGRNPSDESNESTIQRFLDVPRVVLNAQPWAIGMLVFVLACLIFTLYRFKSNGIKIRNSPEFYLILVAIVVVAGASFMTVKEYRVGDLIILTVVVPMSLAASISLLRREFKGGFLTSLLRVGIAIFVSITALVFIEGQVSIVNTPVAADYYAEIDYLEERRIQGDHVVFAYGVFTEGSSLDFGDSLSNHLLVDEIETTYPRQLLLNLETLQIQERSPTGPVSMTCDKLAEIVQSGSALIVAPGRPIDSAALGVANGAPIVELVQEFGEWPVYSLEGFDCPSI